MHLSNMARVKKDSANKKNPHQLQLKKSRNVVEVQQEEDNEEEEVHDFESDKAEDKELVLDLEKDDDDDMDEGFQKKELSTLQKKSYQIKMKKKVQGNKKEEEEDHDLESDKAEDKELGLGLEKDDDDENGHDEEKDDDMDEGIHKKELSTLQKKTKQIEVEEKEQGRKMADRSLYIGKLPYDVTEQDLKDLSKDIVEICIFEHRSSHLRYAIIRFNDEATAETNYNILQTKKIKDQPLTIDFIGRKSTRSKGERDARSLSVQKLPDGVTEQDLKDLSKDIVEICIPKNSKDNFRFAIIRFIDKATAKINYNILQTKKIKDKPLTIDYRGRKSLFVKYVRKEKGDPRTLFVWSLPDDVTEQELRNLSKDIVEIDIRQDRKPFAFLIFDSQAKAKSNYMILKSQKLRGKPIYVIYKYSKSALVRGGQDHNSVKQLSVSGLPLDVTIEQVATHFKKAFQIALNRSNLFRTATVSFDTEEEAKEANDAAKDAKISEYKLITVLCENLEKRPFRATEFRGAPFRGAPFRGALFRGASFRGAPFRGASFRGAPFRGAPFRGGRNNWGKRSHNDNFPGGQRSAKKMRR